MDDFLVCESAVQKLYYNKFPVILKKGLLYIHYMSIIFGLLKFESMCFS